jgi:uncharacterized membrane protein YcaP (DUF421 family)
MTVKILGQRSISQLRLLDFIISIILGNIIADPLSNEKSGMTGSIITTVVIATMYIISLKLTLKFKIIQQFFSPSPITLVKNGEIIYKNLAKAKISIDFLVSELRIEKIDDIKKIAVALWEPGGRISVFLDSPYQTLTPNDMQIKKSPFSLPIVIIREGDIDTKALKDINQTKEWLIEKLIKTYNAEVKNILLATLDSNNHINIFYKHN